MEDADSGKRGNGIKSKDKGFGVLESKFFEHRFIPTEKLGSILHIYSFFQYFDEMLEGPEFEMEELWACFDYKGEVFLELIHDLHTVILYEFFNNLKEYIQKFDAYA